MNIHVEKLLNVKHSKGVQCPSSRVLDTKGLQVRASPASTLHCVL